MSHFRFAVSCMEGSQVFRLDTWQSQVEPGRRDKRVLIQSITIWKTCKTCSWDRNIAWKSQPVEVDAGVWKSLPRNPLIPGLALKI